MKYCNQPVESSVVEQMLHGTGMQGHLKLGSLSWRMAEVEMGDKVCFLPFEAKWPNEVSQSTEFFSSFNDKHLDDGTKLTPSHSARFDRLKSVPHSRILVLVAADERGPFMIVDGNHRAVIMNADNTFVGSNMIVGVGDEIAKNDFWSGSNFWDILQRRTRNFA